MHTTWFRDRLAQLYFGEIVRLNVVSGHSLRILVLKELTRIYRYETKLQYCLPSEERWPV